MLDKIVNLDLLKSPYNWLAVILMVSLGLLLLAVIAPQQTS